jgi:hypothetical protein
LKERYRGSLLRNPNLNKEKYRAALRHNPYYHRDRHRRRVELHPNYSSEEYRRRLSRNPNHIRDKEKRRNKHPHYAIKRNLKSLFKKYVRCGSYQDTNKAYRIFGCSHQELIAHLGNFTGKELDHILPQCVARTPEELEKLWHYTNLQLLTPKENASKGKSISLEAEVLCWRLLGRSTLDNDGF